VLAEAPERLTPTSSSSPPAPRCSSPSNARERAGRRRHQRPRRLGAEPRVVRGAGRRLPRVGAAGIRQGSRVDRGRFLVPRLARATSATPAARLDRALRRIRRLQDPVPASSASPPRPQCGRSQGRRWPAPVLTARQQFKEKEMTSTPTAAALRRRRQHLARRPLAADRLRQSAEAHRRRATSSGVTTNPTIFAAAHRQGRPPTTHQVDRAGRQGRHGASPTKRSSRSRRADVAAPPATSSVPVYDATNGQSTAASRSRWSPASPTTPPAPSQQAKELWAKVDRPNVLIKIPATSRASKPSPRRSAEGISVNVTLIFSARALPRGHQRVPHRSRDRPRQAGHDLSKIHSVASFFVSRVDTEIDKRLDAIGTDEAKALKSKAGVANARLAYQVYEQLFSTERCGSSWPSRARTRSARCGLPPV
jgi:transaldolase